MHMPRWAAALLGSAAIGLAGLASTAPVMASPAAHVQVQAGPPEPGQASPDTFTSHIWLHNSTSWGIRTNGLNAQLTLTQSGQTAFYLNTTSQANWFKLIVDGTTGHCIQNMVTDVRTKTCGAGIDGQKWAAFAFGGACHIVPMNAPGGEMAVYNPLSAGKPIWSDNGGGGTDQGWRVWNNTLWPCP